MGKQIFNPLLEDNFQELNPAGGGGEDLAATLALGNTTGANDIVVSDTQVIKAATGGTTFNISGWGANSFELTTDAGGYLETHIAGSAAGLDLGVGSNKAAMGLSPTTASLRYTGGVTSITSGSLSAGSNTAAIGNILIKPNNGISPTGSAPSGVSGSATFINSGIFGAVSTINAGISNSVALGGVGLTIKTNNTPYANQISLQPSGNTFNGLLAPPALSGDQTYTFQDASGTVAFLSDITGGGLNILETASLDGIIITPPTLTGNVDDYNPTGFSTCSIIRLDIDANNREITGFVAPAAGVNRIITVCNINAGIDDIKFKENDASSVAANRILLRDNGDKAIKANETAIFWYDHTSARWRPYNRIG